MLYLSEMKRLLTILILIFTLQTPSQADDIRDFQIEGMSVGDSLLDHFSEEEIESSIRNYHKDHTFKTADMYSSEFNIYDGVQAMFKQDDRKYIIHGLIGVTFYENNIEECYAKKDEIFLEMKKLFKNAVIDDRGSYSHPVDITGKSKVTAVYFEFKSKDYAQIKCFDWSKDREVTERDTDTLRVGLLTGELGYWLTNVAYN